MKNISLVLFIFILSIFIPSTFVSATSLDSINQNLSNINNSINSSNQALQSYQNTQKRNQLISTYGLLLVNSCSTNERWCNYYKEGMNPTQYATCLNFVELNLTQGVMTGCQKICPIGYTKSTVGNQCITRIQSCKNDYGSNSTWNGKLNDKGQSICDCEKGFIPNPDGSSSCVVETPSGTLCNGKYWNSCPAGQTFYCPPTGDAECQNNQPIKTETKATPPIIKKVPELKTTQVESKDISPSVSLVKDQKFTNSPIVTDTNIVNVEKAQATHKSFWTKIKKWFGF